LNYHLYKDTKFSKMTLLSNQDLIDKETLHVSRRFNDKNEYDEYVKTNPLDLSKNLFIDNDIYRIVTARTGFASVWYYDKDEIEAYMNDHEGSVSGFSGKVMSDWLCFDFDHKDFNHCTEQLTIMLEYLKQHSITYLLFLSGTKGWHLYIPASYLSYPEEYKHKMNVVNRVFAMQLMRQFSMDLTIDPGIYSANTCFRMPFTANEKNGKMKTMFSYNGDKSKSLREQFDKLDNDFNTIKSIKEFFYNLQPSGQLPHWKLDTSMFDAPVTIKEDKSYFEHPYMEKACIYKMLSTHDLKGQRHQIALRLMSYWREKGFDERWTLTLLRLWNDDLNDPMPDSEVSHVLNSFHKIAYNQCKDPLCLEFCCMNNTCQFNRTRTMKDEIISNSNSSINALRESENGDRSKWIYIGNIFPGMDEVILKPDEGHVLFFGAGSSVGKTVAAITVALKAKKPCVIFSYEMSRQALMKRFALMLGLNINIDIDRRQLEAETSHIFIVDRGRVPIQEQPTVVKKIEQQNKVKIQFVISDYFQITPVLDRNNSTRFVTDQKIAADEIALVLPDILKDNQYAMIFTAQPTKSTQGNGNTPLMAEAMKSGQSIEAVADYIITMWRPNFRTPKPDIYFSMWLVKNRHGSISQFVNYSWDGNTQRIGIPVKEQVEQREPIVDN
jgi:hypothetical protein